MIKVQSSVVLTLDLTGVDFLICHLGCLHNLPAISLEKKVRVSSCPLTKTLKTNVMTDMSAF